VKKKYCLHSYCYADATLLGWPYKVIDIQSSVYICGWWI